MPPRAIVLTLLALGACAPRSEPFFSSRPGAPDTNPQVVAACRDQSLRVIARQDRSQLMREDERDSRLGADVTPFTLRTQTDRLGRGFQYDRMVDECVRQNAQATARPTAQPAPEAAPPVPTEPARSRRSR